MSEQRLLASPRGDPEDVNVRRVLEFRNDLDDAMKALLIHPGRLTWNLQIDRSPILRKSY